MSMSIDLIHAAVPRSPGRHKKGFLLAVLLFVVLNLAGCGAGKDEFDSDKGIPSGTSAPPAPVVPPPSSTPVRTARLNIDPSLIGVVTEASSVHETVTSGETIALPVGVPALVFGNNANGEIVALGSSDQTATTISLSAIETAKTLTWMELGGPLFKVPIKEVMARIEQSPAFPALVAAVDKASHTAAGVLQDEVYASLAMLIYDLRKPVPAISTAAEVTSTSTFTVRKDFLPKKFLGYVISDIEVKRPELDTSNLGIWNAGALQWRVQAVPKPGWPNQPGVAMLLPAGSSGFDSYFFGASQGDIELGLLPGEQFVRIFQDRATKTNNWSEIIIFGATQILSFVPNFDSGNKLLTGCIINTLSAATGIRPEDLADLTPEQATVQNVTTMLKGYFTVTGVTGLFGCVGIPDNFKANGRFIENSAKKLLNTSALKVLDGLSLANRMATLIKYQNDKGLEMSVCVANGSVVAEVCDVGSTFNVNVAQTGKTVPPPTELNITVNGNPQQISIFCEADESARGPKTLSLKGLAATNQITARFNNEDIPAVGTYDYRTGAFDITYLTPRTLTVGNPVVSFYDQQQYKLKGSIDLRTGLIRGTFEDLDIVSWTFNATTKECTSTYSFEGGLAPNSK